MLSFGDYVNGLNDNACCQCGRKTGKNSWFVQLSIFGSILDPKIAVEGNPVETVQSMSKVKFVMRDGTVVKNKN